MIRILILMVICVNCYGQINGIENLKYVTSADIKSFDYDGELKYIAESSQIIGLGEATHGTSEFEELRIEIIKLLVTKYSYRHIILEASYPQCIALNEYINNGTGNCKKALAAFVPWPFVTEGMLGLLHWLKEYNAMMPLERKVQFYGMDRYGTHVYRYVKMEEERNGIATGNGWVDTAFFSQLERIEGSEKDKHEQYTKMLKEQMKKPENLIDSIAKTNVIRSYIMHNFSHGGKRRAYREGLIFDMASVLIDSFFKGEKGFIYAHNDHVSKRYSGRESLGKMLYERYGDKYKVIGTELKEGKAMVKMFTNDQYRLDTIDIILQRHSLGYQLSGINKGVLGIDCGKNKGNPIVDKRQVVNSFGATYSIEKADKLGIDHLTLSKSYNYLFIVNSTTPTVNLVKR